MASDEHQIIVKKLIDKFITKGFTIICAAYEGYGECSKEGRHEPDVVARDSTGLIHIGEAETCDSLSDEITGEQLSDFSDRVLTKDKRKIPLYIAIPSDCEQELLNTLRNLGISSRENIFYYKF